MKKRLLLFLILGFIFFPQSVFAKSYNVEPTNVLARYNETIVFQGKPYGWQMQGNYAFHSFDTGEIINRIYYTYENGVKDLDYQNTNYDVSFRIFLPNVAVAALTGYNGGKPIVFLNDNTCYVDYSSSSSSDSTTWSHVFGVKCTNVSFNSATFNVDVMTAPQSAPNATLAGWRYGISWAFDFSPTSNNSDLSSSIKENTQEIKKQTEETKKNTEETKKQTETIKDSNTTEAGSYANGFFNDFSSDDYGLTDVITAPLNFIKSLSSASCTNLKLKVPFLPGDHHIDLPCMSSIYNQYFGDLFTIYQLLTFGMISYWVCVDILRLVNNFKNPDNDEVEVADL